MDAQRALLDELMGAARNLTEEERKGYKEITWDGACPKIHDPKLKESFEKSPRHDSYVPRFEAELAHFCEKLVMDLDRRVRRGRERLTQEVEVQPPPSISAEKSEQLTVLEEKIKKLLEQVETLGEAGKVETLNAEKTALTQQSQNLLMLAQEKKMALCEICGSFLVANDAAERTQSHVTGKQHIGYGMVRDFLEEHKAAKEKAREEERLAREKEAEERRKRRENEYDRRGKGLERGMVEEVGMGGEGWTGSKTITGMEEMEAGADIVIEMRGWRVRGTDHITLLGMVIGWRPEIHITPISGLHRYISEL
ncbi:LUC7 N terminus domain-containing protein [Actinidia rufa]|uniref:LUC7 N terminus domain-containing protein n=1 Tax=Actinidia rufa TaxID=165716 RepID=A0A7J0E653_9ERIC|nr:LUC7 N terminus domain-containing protein [Actinidia rufa]